MAYSERFPLQELRQAPVLLGFGWFLLIVTLGFPEDRISIAISFAFAFVLRPVTQKFWGGQSFSPRLVLWSRVLFGVVIVGFGGWLGVERSGVVAWLGGPTVLVGLWLCSDALVAHRMQGANTLKAPAAGSVSNETLLIVESTLADASRPLRVSEIADRCSRDEPAVRSSLATLVAWGRVETGRNGFENRSICIGQGFSGRDLLSRLARPCRLFGMTRQA